MAPVVILGPKGMGLQSIPSHFRLNFEALSARRLPEGEDKPVPDHFQFERIHRESMRKSILVTRPTIRGVAVRQSRSVAVSR